MNEPGIFIAGTIVSIVVFAGGFIYAMRTFGRWADRQ